MAGSKKPNKTTLASLIWGFSDQGLKRYVTSLYPAPHNLRQNKQDLTLKCGKDIVLFLPFNTGFPCFTKTLYLKSDSHMIMAHYPRTAALQ